MAGPSPEQVDQWLEEVERELDATQRQMEPLVVAQARLQDRRALLKELLASFGEAPSADDHVAGEGTRQRVHRQAVEILREVGRPLHSNDLHAEFLKRNYPVPGAGRPNNITVHITGWSDIISPERGIYGLVEHADEHPVISPPGKMISPRRRKRRTR